MTLSDFRRLFEVLRRKQKNIVSRKFSRTKQERIIQKWNSQNENAPIYFWNIPEIERQWNQSVSGSAKVGYRQYFCSKYLQGKDGLKALALGCGAGGNELKWAQLGCFSRIDAFDLSPMRIRFARQNAEHNGKASVLNYFVEDMARFKSPANVYDVILAEGSLHHFSSMERIMMQIRNWLKPNGFFVVHDFVGPSRFQWTKRQVEVANALLTILPERLRRTWAGGIKRRIDVPGKLRMWLADPSEAAESSHIRSQLSRHFEVMELKEKGGAVINLLFYGIAHHFSDLDPQALFFTRLCRELEVWLMEKGEISSDFLFAVCRKPFS